jgi:hypothetical protein
MTDNRTGHPADRSAAITEVVCDPCFMLQFLKAEGSLRCGHLRHGL